MGVDRRGLPSHELAFNHGDGLARFDGCGAGHCTQDPRTKRYEEGLLPKALEPWIGAGHAAPLLKTILTPPPQSRPRCEEQMVGRVLTGNGITAYGDGHYSLIGGWAGSGMKTGG